MSLDSGWKLNQILTLAHFFFRSIYSLVLGENNAADQARAMQESMSMQVNHSSFPSVASFYIFSSMTLISLQIGEV